MLHLDTLKSWERSSGHTREAAPRRVLWLIDSLTMGGAESLALEFASVSRSAGIELHVCCLGTIEGNRMESELRDRGVPCTNLGARNLRDLAAFRSLLRLLRRDRPDLIHAHLRYASIWGALASRIEGVPMIATLHLMPDDAEPWSAGGVRERLACWLLDRFSAGVIAVSRAVGEAYVKTGRLDARKLRVVHNGVNGRFIDEARRSGAELRRELGLDDDALVISTVSVLRPGKGVDVLIDAVPAILAQVARARVLVAGDGSEREALAQRVRERGLSRCVRLLGYRRDVPRVLAASDLFVLPSHQDAFPTVLLEAMAAGLPVVASAVGGVVEIVSPDETGTLVPPGDSRALGAAIVALAKAPQTRRRMGDEARRRAARLFSIEAWCARLLRAYDAALAHSRTRDTGSTPWSEGP